MDSKWTRHGECSHCGWCCENIGRFEMPISNADPAYARIRGAKPSLNGLIITGDFRSPCPAHINGRCSVYDTRPTTCSDFPSEPNEIKNIPCSYWFEREEGGIVERIGGTESPYPHR